MKKCPQCEFIYEDDQSLCDMDGVLLVFDSRSLPNLHTLATVPALPDRPLRRNRMVPAFATILLTAVIASFYYFSTPRPVPVAPPANNFVPASVIEAPAPPTPTPELNQVVDEPGKPEAKPKAPATKQATTKPAAVKPPEPKKDDSKVGSILKKTGKILKKPFRF